MGSLRSHGVDTVFGVPGGGSNLDVVGAAEASGCRFVLTHTETAAAIMAGVTAELSGRLGVCVATRGPGAASAVNGVAQANLDRQPIVVVTDCVSSGEYDRVSHQRLDHDVLFAAATKASVRWAAGDGSVPDDAVAMAVTGRPGAVHIDLDPSAPRSTWTAKAAAPAPSNIDAVRMRLAAARRPVVVTGVGAVAVGAGRRPALRDAIGRFLRGTNMPVLTTYKARGIVNDRGPSAAGVSPDDERVPGPGGI